MAEIPRLAVYGKGGIGKSTLCANLSYHLAKGGRRVLHIGCDPKHDSTLPLCEGRRIPTLAELLILNRNRSPLPEHFIRTGVLNIDCIEAGGPEPGIGCAGRGIARMFEIFEEHELLPGPYDIVLFDVLGDVVCGGFAAPMRRGYADNVLIVLSDDAMSLYAANNICRAVKRYENNGVRLVGLVMNRFSGATPPQWAETFADHLGTEVLAAFPMEDAVREAAFHQRTLSQYDPENPLAKAMGDLAFRVLRFSDADGVVPRPMEEDALLDFMRSIGDERPSV